MKIILRADVENLGRLGDVVSVKPGYGRNFLIPQGMAMLASPSNIKVFELERKKLQARMDALRAEANGMAEQISGKVLVISMRVGENDKLYGSVTTSIIGDALAAEGIDLDRRRILLDSPIRVLGEHEVRVRLHADVIPVFTVKVVADDRSQAGEEVVVAESAESAAPEAETVSDDAE